MNQAQEFAQKLRQFESHQDLADFLHGQGVVGYKNIASLCPLAVLANRWFPQEEEEAWSVGTISVLLVNEASKSSDEAVLPLASREFVCLFDAGRYPHLIRGDG